jgi:hypothetical protein
MKLSKYKLIGGTATERVIRFLDSIKVEADPEFYTKHEMADKLGVSLGYFEATLAQRLKEYRLLHGKQYLYSNKRNVKNVLK